MIFGAKKIGNLLFFLLLLLVGIFACEKKAVLFEEENDATTIPPKGVQLWQKFSHDFDGYGKLTEDIGLWMHKTETPSEEGIAKWLDKKYAPEIWLADKTLYEPINVIWIDFTSKGVADSRANVEDFLTVNEFFSESPIAEGIPTHSWGYSTFFNESGVYPVHQVGDTWVGTEWPSENNHGRFFQAYNVVNDQGNSAYITSASFSREGVVKALGLFCKWPIVPIPCHHYISFNKARDELVTAPYNKWKVLANPSDQKGLFHFKNEYPYDPKRDFWTGDHNGVRIFVLEKEKDPIEPVSGMGFGFTGVVDSVQIVGDYPESYLLEKYIFEHGDTFSGTYLFDPTTTANSDPITANYYNPFTFASVLFSNGWSGLGDEIRLGPYGQDRIQVVNNAPQRIDSYYARTTFVDGDNILSEDLHFSIRNQHGPPRTMGIYLADSMGQVFGSNALPISLPPLNSFDTNSFIMAFGGDEAPNLWVHGHLLSLDEIVID